MAGRILRRGAGQREQLRLRGIEAWHERVAGENEGDSVQRAHRILSGHGDVTADAAEGCGPLLAAEHAGDLLLHLHHANVPFGQVVVEGDAEVVHESQGFLPVLIEPFEQVLGFGLFAPPAFRSGRGGRCG
jgi:hypothetical protein